MKSLFHEGTEMALLLQREQRDTMWECAGVVRNQERLQQGLDRIAKLERALPEVDVRPSAEGYQDLVRAHELRAGLLVARATLLSAIERKESRGAHQRSDYPEQDPKLKVNFTVTLKNGELVMSHVPVPEVPDYLKEWANAGVEVEPAERKLLE
jgi:succinate dehydrogenase / fumarate reductase flavoprotein subunit